MLHTPPIDVFKPMTLSIDVPMLDHQQLRSGEPPRYLSRTVIGLLLQYFVIGIVYQSFASFAEPIFNNFFHLPPAQANLIGAFSTIVWSCKVVFGILSDCFQIFGYRRKAWMILGWALCAIILLVLGCKNHGEPYTTHAELQVLTNLTDVQAAMVNERAPERGIWVVALCGVASLFYITAIVSADAMVVEMSQREPELIRGRLVSYVYGARNLGTGVAQIMVSVFLNSEIYGGNYSWGMSLNAYFFLLFAPVLMMLPVVVFLLHESTRPVINCPEYLREFWHIVQNQPMWQTMLFTFFFNLFTSVISVTATPIVKYEWAGVSIQNNRWMNALGSVASCFGLWFVSHVMNNCNWRLVIALLLLLQVVLGALVDFFTIFAIIRDEWFTLIMSVVAAIPQGAVDFCPCLVFIELAEEGKEGITYGLLTTMSNVAYMFTPFIGNAINHRFKINQDVPSDSAEMRHMVAIPICLGYALYLASTVFLLLLPNQKHHVRFLRAYAGTQPIFATITLFIGFGSVLATIVTSLFKIFPSTMCLSDGWGTTC